MFFLSGLFVWHSLERKGAARFLGDRARRLGVPFVAAFLVLAPMAYYPSLSGDHVDADARRVPQRVALPGRLAGRPGVVPLGVAGL